jgi:hypothetical protein
MAPLRIVALEGDETGQELFEQSLRLLGVEVLGVETGLGLKAATITPEGADDVGRTWPPSAIRGASTSRS